jgi:hypothetical protein
MKRRIHFNILSLIALAVALSALFTGGPGAAIAQVAMDNTFTYQGYLTQGDTPVDGQNQCDLRFGLWDAAGGGAQLGSLQEVSNVDFNDGYFTVALNDSNQFTTNAFTGDARWLNIEVRCPAGGGTYTNMGRQALRATPYAVHSLSTNQSGQDIEARVADLEGQVAALETLLAHFTRNGNDITISGANLHVVNGTGTTDGEPNSLGNVIIGYNEPRTSGNDRSGSHVLVVGKKNNYTRYGGVVVGALNTISGPYASVSSGSYNTASGNFASVSGGGLNTASGNFASVSGGSFNTASGDDSSVSGGEDNTASGNLASVSGGYDNTASGGFSSISGGHSNTTIGGYSSVSGGHAHTAGGNYNWRAGTLFEAQ